MKTEAGEGGAAPSPLRSARAVRDAAERIFAEAVAGRLEHFAVRLEALPALARRVVEIARSTYPDLRAVPVHGRYRHFGVGGTDRLADLDRRLAGMTETDKLVCRADLVITSVLLDAGAGPGWSYREAASGSSFDRSEGLAVASYAWFAAGGLSSDVQHPLRVDARRLRALDLDAVGRAFQVRPDNPLLGLSGRVAVLQALGHALEREVSYFGGGGEARPGQLAVYLLDRARAGVLPAEEILIALLGAFGAIWPGRERLDGVALGDVWTHSRLGRVPFHKLSQWLAYSLIEPLEQAGLRVTDIEALTGLPEYRNGGLFIDGGVLVPRHPEVLAQTHAIGSDVIIEWRALTVALLDRISEEMRSILGLTAVELPLAKVLEAGTWRAGRVLALEKRADGGSPIRITSDGTVF
jgi:Protein of unknown function (DUF1688)